MFHRQLVTISMITQHLHRSNKLSLVTVTDTDVFPQTAYHHLSGRNRDWADTPGAGSSNVPTLICAAGMTEVAHHYSGRNRRCANDPMIEVDTLGLYPSRSKVPPVQRPSHQAVHTISICSRCGHTC